MIIPGRKIDRNEKKHNYRSYLFFPHLPGEGSLDFDKGAPLMSAYMPERMPVITDMFR